MAESSNPAQSTSAAALLQQQHEALSNGHSTTDDLSRSTEDPFPVLANEEPLPAPVKAKPINISDESAFPSLGGAAPKAAGSLWGAGGSAAQRIKQTPVANGSPTPRSLTPSAEAKPQVYTEVVQLPTADIHVQALASSAFLDNLGRNRSREPEPRTLGEVMKLLMKKHPAVRVEASTSRNVTTFILKATTADGEEEVMAVKRELLGRLAKKVTVDVMVPASLRAFIIGAKGRTLKLITDSTGANVQVPSRDLDAPAEATTDENDEGPLIPIAVSGDSHAVAAAREKILAIVAERASKLVIKIDTVPKEFWPLLAGSRNARINALVEEAGAKDTVTVFIPRAYEKRGVSATEEEEVVEKKENVITVTGEREAVAAVVSAVEAAVSELKRTSKTISLSVNKRQHRFLVGAAAEELLAESGCSVELPPVDDASDLVTIRGPQADLVKALGFVMEKANATPVDTLDLLTAHGGSHDKKLYAANLTRYVLRTSKFRKLSEEHSVSVYLPRPAAIEAGAPLIEIVGKDDAGVKAARQEIITIVRALPPVNFATLDVDSLVHRHLIGKKGSKLKVFQEKRNVELVFPPSGEDRSDILLVFSGEGNPVEVLQEVRSEVLQLAKDAADIKSVTITIPAQLHSTIIGRGGTTLNAVIGEEKLVNVSFGVAKNSAADVGENSVVIRGPSEEVARVKAEIERIAEDARTTAIVNSYIAEFEIETASVRHIVGKSGASVNKLREELGVQVDFVELPVDEKAKKAVPKSKVTIKGRKENVEEAKKRILNQGEKIADDTTLLVAIPATLDRGSLIGKQGIYLKRLQAKYDVRIDFPKDRKNDEDASDAPRGNPNEITIRGPKKGAEAAKKELVDLIDYEKENGNILAFVVSTKSLPRILGKGGLSINAIKEETNVAVDVQQASDDAPTATISLRGTKTGTQAAKTLILAIAHEVDDETTVTLEIPRHFHTTLIGSGGSNIRDLITRCGGPSEVRASANTVRFPKQDEPADTVSIRGPKALVEKIRKALASEVAHLQSRIVLAISVSHTLHASIIGKAAVHLQGLQRKHGVKVIFPGWKEYESTGPVTNPDETKDADAKDIVKIFGPKTGALAAAAELSARRGAGGSGRPIVTATISVPRKHHAKLAQGGRFFRSLPSGTKVTHAGQKPPVVKALKSPKPPALEPVAPGRIDDEDAEIDEEILFQLVEIPSTGEEEDGEIPWVIESTSQEDLDKVSAIIKKSLGNASPADASHIGWFTVPRSLMPRIVGRGGSGLDKLRSAGVEVEVVGRKDANQLMVTGTPENIDEVHRMIRDLNAPRQYAD